MHRDDLFGDIVTPERLAKGDLAYQLNAAGHVRFAQAQRRTVMNFLWDNRILNDQHVHDGQTYELWQTCFSAFLGYRNNPVYRDDLREARTALAADGLHGGDFEKLIRSLSLADKRAVEAAVYTLAHTEQARWLARRNADAYRGAFNRLSAVMDRLRDQARDRAAEQQNACADDRFR